MDVTAIVRPPRHAHPADLPGLAERDMLTMYAAVADTCPLTSKDVSLLDGTTVRVDGVSGAEDLFVIPVCHVGPLPSDAGPHLARDVFSLATVLAERPGAHAVLLFACPQARDDARELVGALTLQTGIALESVDLGAAWNERLIEIARPAGRPRASGPARSEASAGRHRAG